MKRIALVVAVSAIVFSGGRGAFASIENPGLNEYYHLGGYYRSTGQYDKAIANYRSMIGKYPNTREAEEGWLAMGNCYYYLMLGARAELGKTEARTGTTARDIKRLEAKILTNMNDAISSYQKVVGQFPNSKAEAIVRIGRTYLGRGPEKAAEARLQFQKVVNNYPEEAGRAQLLLGDSYMKAGDLESAKQMYGIAQGRFPEVASLATLKRAGCFFDASEFGMASDTYDEVIDRLGIDGAYNAAYHPEGTVMREAIARRGEAGRALKNVDNELTGYKAVASRYAGTNVSMRAKLELAEAYWFYEKKGDATKILEGIASEYPESVWAVRALFLLGSLRGISMEAVLTYSEIIRRFPESRFWVRAKMELARTYLGLAEKETDPVEKKRLREEARAACNAVRSGYRYSPEADEAKVFLEKNGL